MTYMVYDANKHHVCYESDTSSCFWFLCNHALNFGNIAIIYMNGAMHFPIICQSGKKTGTQKLMVTITDYNGRFFVGYDSINYLH